MGKLITTVISKFRLFRQPHRVGDVIEVGNEPLLIIGIERFKLWGNELTIWYTCQNLSHADFITTKNAYKEQRLAEVEARMKHDDERIHKLELGKTYDVQGTAYKAVEYTEIQIKGTDIYIAMAVRPILPVDRKEAQSRLKQERRKKLELIISD